MRHVLLVLLLTACTQTEASPRTMPDLTMSMNVSLGGGEQATHCQYFAMPDEARQITRIAHRYTDVSHHLILYATDLDPSQVRETPFDCSDGVVLDDVVGAFYAAQQPEGVFALRDGSGLNVAPRQIVMLEYHMLNTQAETVGAEATIDVWFGDEPDLAEAGTLFFFDDHIVVPPHATSSASMRCAIPEDVDLALAVPHMHQFGTDFSARVSRDGATTPLIAEGQWTSDEVFAFERAIAIEGGSTIDYSCSWNNPTDKTIFAGPSAVDDEMCVLFGIYYRNDGSRLSFADEFCRAPGSGPYFDGGDASCDVGWACDQATWFEVDDPASDEAKIARWECHNSMCNDAYVAFGALSRCQGEHCRDVCWTDSYDEVACDACLAAACDDEQSGCIAATCG